MSKQPRVPRFGIDWLGWGLKKKKKSIVLFNPILANKKKKRAFYT